MNTDQISIDGVEGEIELEDVHAVVAKKPEVLLVGIGGDEGLHLVGRKLAGGGNAFDLEQGVGGADVGIESAAGRSDGIGGDRLIGGELVFGPIGGDALLDLVGELLGRGPEVAAAGGRGVVADGARRGWARMEVALAAEVLA